MRHDVLPPSLRRRTAVASIALTALLQAQGAEARNTLLVSGKAPDGAAMVLEAEALGTPETESTVSSEWKIGMTKSTTNRSASADRSERGQSAIDIAEVSRLDLDFQAAVKSNDAATIDRILHEDFVLVLGSGKVQTRAEAISEARSAEIEYLEQDEVPGTQVVRVWGDTAVVTAKLNIRGRHGAALFNRTLWFSDTYVRTAQGWRYAFGQASLPLPAD